MRVGVISDTHGLFDEKVPAIFAGVELILHAGDIGKIEVMRRLEEIAPVRAVEGNNDRFKSFPPRRVEEIAGRKVMIQHIFGEIHRLDEARRRLVERVRPDVLVFGHSHRPYCSMLGVTLLFNPGSAGPRRFSLPRTVGILSFGETKVDAEIIGID